MKSRRWFRDGELLRILSPCMPLDELQETLRRLGYNRSADSISSRITRSGAQYRGAQIDASLLTDRERAIVMGETEQRIDAVRAVVETPRGDPAPWPQCVAFVLEPRGGRVQIVPLGDMHYGHRECDVEYLRGVVDWIAAKPGRYWCGLGDWIEAVPANYKIPTWEQTTTPGAQVEEMIALLSPVADRGLWVMDGNHEERIMRSVGMSPSVLWARELGVRAHRGGYIALRVGGTEYTVVAEHGESSARSNVSEIHALRTAYPDGDVYLMGHDHRLVSGVGMHFATDGIRRYYWARCGSCLHYPSYAARKVCVPHATGLAVVTLWGAQRRVRIDVGQI